MLKKIYIKQLLYIIICMYISSSCSKYLDIVPDDGLATLESAFSMRSEAKKYLYTCYSYMPADGTLASNPALMGGDEAWSIIDSDAPVWNDALFRIARGFQNATSPLGGWFWVNLYQGIRVCNIFLENIDMAPDLPEGEKLQWIAEVKVLKAYYHFYLFRMYGPVPVVKQNLSINASPEELKISRNTVDEVVEYIVEILDEAIPDLPPEVLSRYDELGRITKPIAATLKAKVLVTAASPLFNGNTDQATLKNKDGTQLFNQESKPEKWEAAMLACRDAIEICRDANISLYRHKTHTALKDTLLQELTIRNTLTEKWNSEIIWANTIGSVGEIQVLQRMSTPNLAAAQYPDNDNLRSQIAPSIKIAEMFYTSHGVPLDEDKDWQSLDLFSLREGGDSEKYYIRRDYTTIQLNFDREPRFYACLGFDGGIWYGQNQTINNNSNPNPNDMFWIGCRIGGYHQKRGSEFGPFTGYFMKKTVHYQNIQTAMGSYTIVAYPWPILRLADLYLLYAESINELEGPNGPNSSELFRYIDSVRSKAGLPGVKYSWDNYTDNTKYNTKAGMKDIIHRERLIELFFEGQRFWDLRRWKEAPAEYAKPVEGFKISARQPAEYYQRVFIAQQTFTVRDYFWPIQTSYIDQNPNLVQNIGW